MKFLFTGDFYSGNLEEPIFDQSILDLFDNKISILNLESPLIKSGFNKKIKSGPHLSSPELAVNYLKQLNVNLVCLANNHICDYEKEGIDNTLKVLEQNLISYTGFNYDYHKISENTVVLNICENEWVDCVSKAGKVNVFNHLVFLKILEQKKQKKKVIVIYHGGVENLNIPSPNMVDRLRSLVDFGADLVISHHTHKISGWESYRDKNIFYGLGNFYFSNDVGINHTNEKGLLVEISENLKDFKLHFVEKRRNILYLLEENEVFELKKSQNKINELIASSEKLNSVWKAYCEQNKLDTLCELYLSILPNKVNYLLKKSGLYKLLLNKMKIRRLINFIRSESHSERVIDTLNIFK
ncbi:MAG: CapA family protein [Flavobacteriaceae bacterium]|nr:CapA family protein [Flavobacteriaceae bacterium]